MEASATTTRGGGVTTTRRLRHNEVGRKLITRARGDKVFYKFDHIRDEGTGLEIGEYVRFHCTREVCPCKGDKFEGNVVKIESGEILIDTVTAITVVRQRA